MGSVVSFKARVIFFSKHGSQYPFSHLPFQAESGERLKDTRSEPSMDKDPFKVYTSTDICSILVKVANS